MRYRHSTLFAIANGLVEWKVLLYTIEVPDSSFCLGTVHSFLGVEAQNTRRDVIAI